MEFSNSTSDSRKNTSPPEDGSHIVTINDTTPQKRFNETITIKVKNLEFEVDGQTASWWQRLAAFQMPWEWASEKTHKKILSEVSFQVSSGQMLAVLGSSGSGKTSMLDVLANRTTTGTISGDIYLNDKVINSETIKNCSAYVTQHDRLLPTLTVKETLMFVGRLKLPKEWSQKKISERVQSVIGELGLRHVTDSKIGGVESRGISGGERRRVSIGVQLLLDPYILFLDEPTSGLDSFTANHLMGTLANLANNNRIVLLSIHQPRSDIFELFDLIMLLSQGRIMYYGKAQQMVDYFTGFGYPCPPLTNPCDFYVDLTTVDMKSVATENETSERVKVLMQHYKDHQTTTSTQQSVTSNEEVSELLEESPKNGDLGNGRGIQSILQNEVKVHGVGVWQQFTTLFKRYLRNSVEDYQFLSIQAIEALCMSLMIGLVFYNLTLDQTSVRDRFGLLYIIGALYPYMVILDVIWQYHKQRGAIYHEMQDGMYTAGPLFFSKVLSEIPEHSFFMILYTVPVYFLSGLQEKPELFFQSFGIIYLVVYVSRSLAMFAAAVMPTYQMSVLFAQTFFTIFLLSSGFIFNLDNLFEGVRWTTYISYLKWGYQALCKVEFPGLEFTCPPILPPSSCVITGEDALKVYSLQDNEIWHSVSILFAEIVVFLACFYVALKLVSQKPHQT